MAVFNLCVCDETMFCYVGFAGPGLMNISEDSIDQIRRELQHCDAKKEEGHWNENLGN